jgi:hypothetical protein
MDQGMKNAGSGGSDIDLDGIDMRTLLANIERRMKEVDFTSDDSLQKAAQCPGAISNMRAGLKEDGKRKGITTRTLGRLAKTLKVTSAQLITGDWQMDKPGDQFSEQWDSLPPEEEIVLLTWTLRFVSGAPEDEAKIFARALSNNFHTRRSRSGEPMTLERRQEDFETVVRSFRPDTRR